MNTRRLNIFLHHYGEELTNAINNSPDRYAYGVDQIPEKLELFRAAILSGKMNLASPTVQQVCKTLGIKFGVASLTQWLHAEDVSEAQQSIGCEIYTAEQYKEDCMYNNP